MDLPYWWWMGTFSARWSWCCQAWKCHTESWRLQKGCLQRRGCLEAVCQIYHTDLTNPAALIISGNQIQVEIDMAMTQNHQQISKRVFCKNRKIQRWTRCLAELNIKFEKGPFFQPTSWKDINSRPPPQEKLLISGLILIVSQIHTFQIIYFSTTAEIILTS